MKKKLSIRRLLVLIGMTFSFQSLGNVNPLIISNSCGGIVEFSMLNLGGGGGGDSPNAYIIYNFGDGSPVLIEQNESAWVSHTYSSPGTYNVTAHLYTYVNGVWSISIQGWGSVVYQENDPLVGIGENCISLISDGMEVEVEYIGGSYLGGIYNSFVIDYGDGTVDPFNNFVSNGQTFNHTYAQPGQYTVTLTITAGFHPSPWCSHSCSAIITVGEPECCTNFAPLPDGRYWLSAWVKENQPSQVITYDNAYIELEFFGPNATVIEFHPSGEVIEGWQRIVGEFIVPQYTTNMDLHLINDHPTIEGYFDDIRIHPFNASMKSYVYDPETLWLTAELDDNNYATFYEYDKEGQLIRIKKETARGIMTIQESRTSNPKIEE